jgi:uncharacterized protein (TIGR00369 family)
MMADVPDGFELMPPYGPSHELVGPIHFRSPGTGWIIGMRVAVRHHNRGPMIHGGMMAFLIDTAFTYVCMRLRDPALKGSVTTQLSVDFVGSATAGDWIEVHVDPVRIGRRVAFLSGMVFKGTERIARASALFQMITQDPA